MSRPTDSRRTARRRQLWPTADGRQPTAASRPGLTLIEMLMATAITLLMMAAVVSLFANMSGSIRNRRAVIELSSQLRQVRHRLARDLAGCTVPRNDEGLVPWQRAGEAIGYFELVEGDQSDSDPTDLLRDRDNDGYADGIDIGTTQLPGSQLADVDAGVASDAMGLGDFDDVLALTVRSESEPFVARVGNDRVESTLAEVVWYCLEAQPGNVLDVEPGMRTVYRRVLLIAPWLGPWDASPGNDRPRDVSVHFDNQADNNPSNDVWIANTLADLTRREYRFAHNINFNQNTPPDDDLDFPHEFDHDTLINNVPLGELIDPEYLMLNDVLAWDLRAYDPGAPLYAVSGGVVVDPNDPGWQRVLDGTLTGTLAGYGAYVDLGWNNALTYTPVAGAPIPLFQQERQAGWHPNAPNLFRGNPSTYDTWTWHYENDRRNQYEEPISDTDTNGDSVPDRFVDDAVDGIDDDGINGVDDPAERETWPPYNVPLRGVRVVLRTYEFDSRQIREASVTSSFVP